MAIVQGLSAINKRIEASESRGGDESKTKWFKLRDKQAVKVVFLQELDSDSPNYSEKNGLACLAVEHQHPKNFRVKALCTIDDEGACYGCEQARANPKTGWHQRTKFYANVLVDEGDGEPYVAVLSQGLSGRAITPTLIEYAGDDDTITDKYFNIRRMGAEVSDTSYTIRAGKEHDLNVEDYEVYDIKNVLREVPYAEQAAFYSAAVTEEDSEKEPVSVGAGDTSSSTEW